MPTQEFALDPTGVNRIQIYQGNDPGKVTILLNRSIVGTISSQEELSAGKDLTLKDGTVLQVRFDNNSYILLRDGQPLPFMSADAIKAAEAHMKAEESRKQEAAHREVLTKGNALQLSGLYNNTTPSSTQTNGSAFAFSRSSLGPIIAIAGALLSLIAFLALPYFSLGPLSITALQAASGNIAGFQFGGQPMLWLEMIIAGILIILGVRQVMKSTNPRDDMSSGDLFGMVALAAITLVVILAKYFLFDSQPTVLGTNLLGNDITAPAISSFYGSGYWVYIVSLVITIVGGVIALRDA